MRDTLEFNSYRKKIDQKYKTWILTITFTLIYNITKLFTIVKNCITGVTFKKEHWWYTLKGPQRAPKGCKLLL